MFRNQALSTGNFVILLLTHRNSFLKKAIGIALESMRLDILEEAISKGDAFILLGYVLESAMTLIQNLTFRNQVCLFLK